MLMCPRPRDPTATVTVPQGQASGGRSVSVAGGTEPSSYGSIRQEAGTPFRGNGVRIWGTDGNPGRPPATWSRVGLGRNTDV